METKDAQTHQKTLDTMQKNIDILKKIDTATKKAIRELEQLQKEEALKALKTKEKENDTYRKSKTI